VDPTAGLDNVQKTKFLTLPGLELRPLGHPARSRSLSRPKFRSRTRKRFEVSTAMSVKISKSLLGRDAVDVSVEYLFLG
jgi:hypothetical protein